MTIRLNGRFDFACHSEFRSACRALPPDGALVVDMAEVTYMDGAALGMLLQLRERQAAGAEPIRLTNARGQPREILDLANFGRLFRID